MLSIITNKDLFDIKKHKFISLPYKRFDIVLKYEGGISQDIAKIIKDIDECDISTNGMVISKFNKEEIETFRISEGAKTVAYVMFCYKKKFIKEIINITSCGPNAIKYIIENFAESNLELYLGHFDIPNNIECKIKFNERFISNTSQVFEK